MAERIWGTKSLNTEKESHTGRTQASQGGHDTPPTVGQAEAPSQSGVAGCRLRPAGTNMGYSVSFDFRQLRF